MSKYDETTSSPISTSNGNDVVPIKTIKIDDEQAYKLPGRLIFHIPDTDPDLVTRKIQPEQKNKHSYNLGIQVRNSFWVLCSKKLIEENENPDDKLVITKNKNMFKKEAKKHRYCIRFVGPSENLTSEALKTLDWAICQKEIDPDKEMTVDFPIPYYRSIKNSRKFLKQLFENIEGRGKINYMSIPLSFRPFSWFWSDSQSFYLNRTEPNTTISNENKMFFSIFGFPEDKPNEYQVQELTFAVLGMIQQTSNQNTYPPQKVFLEKSYFNTVSVPEGPDENNSNFGIVLLSPFINPVAQTCKEDPTQAVLNGHDIKFLSLVSKQRKFNSEDTNSKFYATVKQGVKILLDPKYLKSVSVGQIVTSKQTFNIFEISSNYKHESAPERTIVKALYTSKSPLKKRPSGEFFMIKFPREKGQDKSNDSLDTNSSDSEFEKSPDRYFFVPMESKGVGKRNIFPNQIFGRSAISQESDFEVSATTSSHDDLKPPSRGLMISSLRKLLKYTEPDNSDIIRITKEKPKEYTSKVINDSFVRWVMIVGHGRPDVQISSDSQPTNIILKFKDDLNQISSNKIEVLSNPTQVTDEKAGINTAWYKIDRLIRLKKHSLAETPTYSPFKLSIGQQSFLFKVDWNESIMSHVNLIDGPINDFSKKVTKSVIWDTKKEAYLVVCRGLIRASNARDFEKSLSIQKELTYEFEKGGKKSIEPGEDNVPMKAGEDDLIDLCSMNQFGTDPEMTTNVFSKVFRSNSKDDVKSIYVCREELEDQNGWKKSRVIDKFHFYKTTKESTFKKSKCNQGNCQISVILVLLATIFTFGVCL